MLVTCNQEKPKGRFSFFFLQFTINLFPDRSEFQLHELIFLKNSLDYITNFEH